MMLNCCLQEAGREFGGGELECYPHYQHLLPTSLRKNYLLSYLWVCYSAGKDDANVLYEYSSGRFVTIRINVQGYWKKKKLMENEMGTNREGCREAGGKNGGEGIIQFASKYVSRVKKTK